MTAAADRHGNRVAREGLDRCSCGCKYWENDRCIDCGAEPPALAVGDLVNLPGRHKGGIARVDRIGNCGHGGCKWGARCATVSYVGGFTTLNFDADTLERVE